MPKNETTQSVKIERRILSITIFLICLPVIPGILYPVLIPDNVAKFALLASAMITTALALLYHRIKKRLGSPIKITKMLFLTYPLLIAFFILLIYGCLSIGTIRTLHLLTSKESRLIVTIASKPSTHHSRTCSGRVHIKGYNYLPNKDICGINKETWNKLQRNDSLILTGSQSPFGFHYKKYIAIDHKSQKPFLPNQATNGG